MTPLVVDCSAVATWCFEDERTPASDDLLMRVAREGLLVPRHWHLEVVNMLRVAERRRRITTEVVASKLADFSGLPASVDMRPPVSVWAEIAQLSRSENLTAYDAAYLSLALHERTGLATKDADLIVACRRRGVPIIPVQSLTAPPGSGSPPAPCSPPSGRCARS